jgi:hypothetical protein
MSQIPSREVMTNFRLSRDTRREQRGQWVCVPNKDVFQRTTMKRILKVLCGLSDNSNPTFVAQEYPERRLSKGGGYKAITKRRWQLKVVLKSGR